jgi:Domain of Unknown Function with PDB structure (DUF3857)/Transglutaminase-like superfamily
MRTFILNTLLRRCLPFLLFFPSLPALAQGWIQPTPEELKMTAEPAAPNAAAIYLYRDERADDLHHLHSLSVRLKVLTEEGKRYADVELGYDGGGIFDVKAIDARTIHSDGTVIPFTGKPYEKVLEKSQTFTYKAKVFSLPDVQVGSILEYRYTLDYGDNWYSAPHWYIQQPLYVRKAHYQFVPIDTGVIGHRGAFSEGSVAYTPWLPKGVEVKQVLTSNNRLGAQGSVYTLDMENVDPIPEEEYMPPMRSLSYRVLFYYSDIKTAADFWKPEGKYWSHDVDNFMAMGKLGATANQIAGPSDTPEQKARKLYDAVMKLENTSFTRGHTHSEDKAAGIKTKNADDIWAAKRGNANEIALLYVGLARAAGLQAYAAQVTNRDQGFFAPGFLSLDQLDDYLAVVVLNGKEQYLDPGERYCPFGDLDWRHAQVQGLRQTDRGTDFAQTPGLNFKTTSVVRTADLNLEENGKVTGTLKIIMTGSRALHWRQQALRTDEAGAKREFDASIQGQIPPGIEVKTERFSSLEDYDKNLMAVMTVTGNMGTATAKRVFLPATFFEAGSKPLFVHEKRTVPVDLDYPYQMQDTVTLHLPKNFTLESAPKDTKIPLQNGAAYDAVYQASFKPGADTLEAKRVIVLATSVYSAQDYPSLKDFFQQVTAKDQEQAVLQMATVAAAQTGSAK